MNAATADRGVCLQAWAGRAENLGAAALRLDRALVERIDALAYPRTVSGERYSAQSTREVDTEEFGPAPIPFR